MIDRWSSDLLDANYSRSLLGYDLRPPLPDWRTTPKPPYAAILTPFVATADNGTAGEVWDRVEYAFEQLPYEMDVNGWSIVSGSLDVVKRIKPYDGRTDFVIVAIDLPTTLGELGRKPLGFRPVPLEKAELSGFEFLGFDIHDYPQFSSVLYCYGWANEDLQKALDDMSVTINQYGLIPTQADAVRATQAFAKRFDDWLFPSGVWMLDPRNSAGSRAHQDSCAVGYSSPTLRIPACAPPVTPPELAPCCQEPVQDGGRNE